MNISEQDKKELNEAARELANILSRIGAIQFSITKFAEFSDDQFLITAKNVKNEGELKIE